jgi:hypothetical protein
LIEFIQSKKQEDCYIEVVGFKSYAQLFYKDKKEPTSPKDLDVNYIYWGATTKPVYIITRVNKLAGLYAPEQFTELYRKYGYVFLQKK